MSKNLAVIGYYSTQFGELWEKSLTDLIKEAVEGVLLTTKINLNQIDAIFFGNMLSGVLENNLHLNAKIAEILKINIPIFRLESACASGGFAFHLAKNYIQSGSAKTVLVLGAEKMTDYGVELVTQGLSAAASGAEQFAGLTFPGLYGIIARNYLDKFNLTETDLARISVKNHFHGSLNSLAQFQGKITLEQVLKSQYVANPLKVLDCSPISDGASSVILTNDQELITKNPSVKVLASEVATDTISLNNRESITSLKSTQLAAKKAFKTSKLKPKEIDIAELHDCFSVAEALAIEDIGFTAKGKGCTLETIQKVSLAHKKKEKDGFVKDLDFPIINTSGGLKAAGHPVGATGIKQIGEVYLQLTNQANARQVKNAKLGLTQNVGGSGGSCAVTIFKKFEK